MLHAELPMLAAPSITAGGPARVATLLREVEQTVTRHYPSMFTWLWAALAVAAVRCLRDTRQPVALIGIGLPGVGKTAPFSFLTPTNEDDDLAQYFYRSDGFTPSAFVSHLASKTTAALDDIDLLPRIKDRTLLTPELAPIFRSRGSDLHQRVSILASVLDGNGYVSDSGAHGRRGYQGDFNFGWIGASTPLTDEAWKALASIGPKLFFFDVTRRHRSAEELACSMANGDDDAALQECRAAVREFIGELYWAFAPGSVPMRSVEIGHDQRYVLALWVQLMTRLRAGVHGPEFPERPLKVLRLIAVGSALTHGRTHVADEDLALVSHIAMSSSGHVVAKVLRALMAARGVMRTPDLTEVTELSAPTVRRYMDWLQLRGVAVVSKGSPQTVELTSTYRALHEAPLLTTPPGC
jgi:hypothetical protein